MSVVFGEGNIQHPVQLIFNGPVCALKLEQPLSRYVRMTA